MSLQMETLIESWEIPLGNLLFNHWHELAAQKGRWSCQTKSLKGRQPINILKHGVCFFYKLEDRSLGKGEC